MPLARYFSFVGVALLALLFGVDAYLPKPPIADSANAANAATALSVIRIHSDRKWPERVEFDTSRPTITPAPVRMAEADVPAVTEAAAPARMRDAFAQLQTSEPKKPEVKLPPPKRKVAAKSHVGPPAILVAQQPRQGFFANNIW